MNPLQPDEVSVCVVDECAFSLNYLLHLLPDTNFPRARRLEMENDLLGRHAQVPRSSGLAPHDFADLLLRWKGKLEMSGGRDSGEGFWDLKGWEILVEI